MDEKRGCLLGTLLAKLESIKIPIGRRARLSLLATLIILTPFVLCCGALILLPSSPQATEAEPVPTLTPTAPPPTATPRPTDTPQPTATPRPTNTPQPTATPRPTNTPEATATPRPTNTPQPTATPRPTDTPQPPTAAPPTATSEPAAEPPPPTAPPPRDYVAEGVWRCPSDISGAAYVGSAGSDKFHYPHCTHAQRIADHNRLCFANREAASAYGYVPCGGCKP